MTLVALSVATWTTNCARVIPDMGAPVPAVANFGQTNLDQNKAWPFSAKLTRISVSMFWANFYAFPMLGLPPSARPPSAGPYKNSRPPSSFGLHRSGPHPLGPRHGPPPPKPAPNPTLKTEGWCWPNLVCQSWLAKLGVGQSW